MYFTGGESRHYNSAASSQLSCLLSTALVLSIAIISFLIGVWPNFRSQPYDKGNDQNQLEIELPPANTAEVLAFIPVPSKPSIGFVRRR